MLRVYFPYQVAKYHATMTANEMLQYHIENAGIQISACYAGISEEEMDCKAAPAMMSPRETAAHLCEVYHAFLTEADGGTHEWGSYDVGDTSSAALISKMNGLREKSVSLALSTGDEKIQKSAAAYISLHDPYHVGQICVARMSANPNFNPYSIYGM